MAGDAPFNPLDKGNLATSVARAALEHPARPLSREATNDVVGEGVYLLYYRGGFPAYEALSRVNEHDLMLPIYVGKAMLPGGRKGIDSDDDKFNSARPIRQRLREHLKSIDEATNLELMDFFFRHLSVDSTFVALGESGLINRFFPVWNGLIDGFGNHQPGGRRSTSVRSRWDTLHPGRSWAEELQPRDETMELLASEAVEYLRARIPPPTGFSVDVQYKLFK